MSTPRWLEAYITSSGMPDPRRAGRNARPRLCTCGALVLHGADHHRIAAFVDVDPYALDAAGEGRAILAGAATYELAGEPPQWELRHRTYPGVPALWPVPNRGRRVVAAHSCSDPPYSDNPITTRAARPRTAHDAPPY